MRMQMYTTVAGETALKLLALKLANELANIGEDLAVKAGSEAMDGIDILDTVSSAIDCLKLDIAVHYQSELDRLEDRYVKCEQVS